MILIESGLVLVAVSIAFAFPAAGSRFFEAMERAFGRLARKRGLAVVLVGGSALALRAALLPILPIPDAAVSDEFSYLLAADTFAHGRMTNSAHPMWVHFEAIEVIQQPTYASKYPPAQGLMLAAGRALFGHPFWGVWLSVGLMCGAICWALQGWLGEGWALLGGFLAVLHLGVFGYWDNSYWGGAVAAIGGALVLGALPRIQRDQRVRDAVLMGLGLGILANSRPYEGLVFSLPLGVAFMAWLLGRNRPALGPSIRRVLLPLCATLLLAGGFTGYYNRRVTGSPLRMPFQVFQAAYDPSAYFLWQSPKPLPAYRHQEMRDWELKDLWELRDSRSASGLSVHEAVKMVELWLFYIGPLLSLPLLFAIVTLPYGFSWKDIGRPTRLLLVAGAVSFAGMALEVYFFPHYAAPMTALILALVLTAMHRVRGWRWRGKPVGLAIVRSVPVLATLLFAIRIGAAPLHVPSVSSWNAWGPWFSPTPRYFGHAGILSELRRYPGRQLVFVRYGPMHYSDSRPETRSDVDEWVYNDADIDASRVVWAQDMGPSQNEELARYFRDRRAWVIDADEHPPRLRPYAERANALRQSRQ